MLGQTLILLRAPLLLFTQRNKLPIQLISYDRCLQPNQCIQNYGNLFHILYYIVIKVGSCDVNSDKKQKEKIKEDKKKKEFIVSQS